MKKQTKTSRLLIVPYAGEKDLEAALAPVKEAFASLPASPENDRFYHVFLIKEKKSGEALGFLRAQSAEKENAAEIELSLFAAEKAEKTAVEALKGGARLLFSTHRDLKLIETWLNPDISFIRILEKAGFERVFERDGVVRYEKPRPRFPFLAFFMLLCTALGVLFGYFFDNYPLCIAAGIAAGILPGALIEKALAKKKR